MFTRNGFYTSFLGIYAQILTIFFFLEPYYSLFFRVETQGIENIPTGRSVIFASSHSSYHDPPLMAVALKRSIAYMAKKELFNVPVLSQIINMLGAFPVNRQKLEISTIKTAKHILTTKKWHLGIFPQGTRIMNGSLDEVKPGFSYLAIATKAPVIPVYIDIKRGSRPFYGKAIVKIGKPLPECKDPEQFTENWKAAVAELMGGGS